MSRRFLARASALSAAVLATAALSTALLPVAARAGANAFTPVELFGGQTNHLIHHPTEAGLVYAASASGIYRSTDEGQTWTLIADGFTSAPSDIAVYDEYAFAVAGNRLHSSEPSGTFEIVDSLPSVTIKAVEFASDGTLYVATTKRVYRSTDFGVNWVEGDEIDITWGDVVRLHADAVAADTVYITTQFGVAARSIDGGASWDEIPGGFVGAFDIATSSDGVTHRLWIAATDGIWVDTNASGGAFFQASTGDFSHVASNPADAATVYAVERETGLYKVFADASLPQSLQGNAYTGKIESVAAHPTSADELVIGGQTGVLRTTDGGTTWVRSENGIYSAHANKLVSNGSNRVYVDAQAIGIHAINSDDLSVEAADNDGLRGLQDSSWLLSLNAIDVLGGTPDTLYAITENDVFRSTDAGASWVQRSDGAFGANVEDLAIASEAGSTVLLARTADELYRSTDGGENWSPVAGLNFFRLPALAVAQSETSVAYLGAFDLGVGTAQVLRSEDGGGTWAPTAALNTDSVSHIAIALQDEQTVYVASDVLLKSTNGGGSWEELSWYPDLEAADAVAIDPQDSDIVYVANSRAIARSVDGGESWQYLPNVALDGTSPARWIVSSMAVDPAQPHRVFLGLNGHGVREISIEPDLVLVADDAPGPVGRGLPHTFTFWVTNDGPFDATDVTTTFTLPASAAEVTTETSAGNCVRNTTTVTCSLPILRADETAEIELTVAFDAAGTVDISASVAGAQPDPITANNTATAEAVVAARAELALMIVGPIAGVEGEPLTYTATVTNDGPDAASNVVLDFEVASGLTIATATPSQGSCDVDEGTLVVCTLGTLNADTSATLTVVTSAPAVGSYAQAASVASTTLDTAAADNSAEISTVVTAQSGPTDPTDPPTDPTDPPTDPTDPPTDPIDPPTDPTDPPTDPIDPPTDPTDPPTDPTDPPTDPTDPPTDPTDPPPTGTDPPSNPPSNPPRSGGGGGGGSSSWLMLALLGLLGFAKQSRQQRL